MRKFILAAFAALLIAAPASAHTVYLPIVGKSPALPTFNLQALRVPRLGHCLTELPPGSGQVCPWRGDFPVLVAENPASLAAGGRQGDGRDAAWAGSPADFTLVQPGQVVADAVNLDIEVSGYDERAGLFQSPGGPFDVIVMPTGGDSVTSAGGSQALPPVEDEADFVHYLRKMMDEGQGFSVDWSASTEFWEQYALSKFTLAACGVSHALWVPEPKLGMWIEGSRAHFFIRGYFVLPGVVSCMGQYRWVKVGELMTAPAAKNVQDRVNHRRGGAITPFVWFTDAQGQQWAFYATATGTLAYYMAKLSGAVTAAPSLFLFVPRDFLDLTCAVTNGVKTCLIQETEPGQAVPASVPALRTP